MRSYLKHKKPKECSPSPFISAAFRQHSFSRDLPILDLACGYGRNAKYLDGLGYTVIAADFDEDIFLDGWLNSTERSNAVRLNAKNSLPFKDSVFSAIVVVHYYSINLFLHLKDLVVPGGFIVYESISARGGNWIQLPRLNEAMNHLEGHYNMVVYNERPAGPHGENATLKMIARRRV